MGEASIESLNSALHCVPARIQMQLVTHESPVNCQPVSMRLLYSPEKHSHSGFALTGV